MRSWAPWRSYAIATSDPTRDFGLELGEKVALTDKPAAVDGTLRIPSEAWLRLITGRLAPQYTPASGNVAFPTPIGIPHSSGAPSRSRDSCSCLSACCRARRRS